MNLQERMAVAFFILCLAASLLVAALLGYPRWKAYLRRKMAPFITGTVIEVGAGIGGTTENLATLPNATGWLCVEPDEGQCAALAALRDAGSIPTHTRVHHGILADLPPSLDAGEITDKGSLNSRLILTRRDHIVAKLYDSSDADVIKM